MTNKYLVLASVLLIGMAASGSAASPDKATVTTLLSFAETNGAYPFGGLVYNGSNTLYGAAFAGGKYGYGVIYELTETGSGTWTPGLIYTFENPATDGSNPYGSLLIGSDGQLYGTTTRGGANGLGAVFELTPPLQQGGGWTRTLLYSFGSSANDGVYPYGGLVMANGVLYGTTVSGGASGLGTVYSLMPSGDNWIETVLYSFAGGTDVSNPYATLTMASGALYGTAPYGGTNGSGAVFALTPGTGGSWSESLLCAFPGGTGGANPYGGVIIGASGGLYGATTNGGSASAGTIYRCAQPKTGGAWITAVLYNLPSYAASYSTLVTDSTGALYGTTPGSHGNSANDGIVFKLTPPATTGGSWTPSTLYGFPGALGNGPRAGLTWGPNGALLGATVGLGPESIGTVFEMTGF